MTDNLSPAQKVEVTTILAGILGYLKIYGMATVTIFFAAVWFVINDHYCLAKVTEDTDWMKPRVQSMWYKGHPDMQESVDATIKHTEVRNPLK